MAIARVLTLATGSRWAETLGVSRRHGERGGVYLGLNIVLSEQVKRCQDDLCGRIGLRPQTALHVTLAYLGRMPIAALDRLSVCMRGLKHSLPQTLSLDVSSVVAAARFEDPGGGGFECFGSAEFADLPRAPRMAWWVIRRLTILDRIREKCFRDLSRIGIETPRDEWMPHVTLGADDDEVLAAYKHMVGILPVGPPIDVPYPPVLQADRLHLTNGETQPQSLRLVWQFRPSDSSIGQFSS